MKRLLFVFSIILLIISFIPSCIGLCFYFSSENGAFDLAESDMTIRYLDVTDNKIKKARLEKYLVGVVAAEMPAEYHIEALKAQAVAARSYILKSVFSAQPRHSDADICNNPNHCKAYLGEESLKDRWPEDKLNGYLKKICLAVDSTRGEYLTCEDQVVEAFFFARSGGKTENSEDVWGESRPYLKSVDSREDLTHPDFLSTVNIQNLDARKKLNSLNKNISVSDKPISVKDTLLSEGGSVLSICLDGEEFKGTEIRTLFGLKSANFSISSNSDVLTFSVLGYGHGVGMSQFGANCRAKNGEKYTEILSHYYTNIQIARL